MPIAAITEGKTMLSDHPGRGFRAFIFSPRRQDEPPSEKTSRNSRGGEYLMTASFEGAK
jgi:hypothetical protein